MLPKNGYYKLDTLIITHMPKSASPNHTARRISQQEKHQTGKAS